MNVWMIAAFVVVLAGVAYWLVSRRSKDLKNAPLKKKGRYFSSSEKTFFKSLSSALADDFYLLPNISVKDIVETDADISFLEKKRVDNVIASLNFDYLICNKSDFTVYGVIELENFGKESREDAKKRETLINQVCKSANLKLFYFDVKQNYEGVDIKRLITGKPSKKFQKVFEERNSQMTVDDSSYAVFSKRKVCPKCNGDMAVKVAVRGKDIGEKFIMCRKYPYCDYRVRLDDKKVAKVNRSDRVDEQKPGFRDWSST